MRQARLAVALALALPLVACGTEASTPIDAGAELAHLSLIRANSSAGGMFIEGALLVALVRDQRGELLHRQVVNYPQGEGDPAHYDLIRDVELPAGPLVVRVELRVCDGSCARPSDLNTLSDDELPALHGRHDVCEVNINLDAGEDREVVLIDGGQQQWECEIANPRPGEGPPEWGRLTLIHDTQGRAPVEGAAISVGTQDEDGLGFNGNIARYPGTPFDPDGTTRYDLLRDLLLPPGRWQVLIVVWVCPENCPNPDTSDEPFAFFLRQHTKPEWTCELHLDFAPGEHHEIVLVNEDDSYLPACPQG